MDPIWIDLIAVVVIVAVIVIALIVRHRLRGGHDSTSAIDPADLPDQSQDARMTAAARFSDRTGFGAGGGV